jgi:HK97 family phage portal protein
MGLIRQFFGTFSNGQTRSKGRQESGPFGYQDEPAVPVTADTAMQLSAVFACVRIITESIGALDIRMMAKNNDGSNSIEENHDLAVFLKGKINKWQTWQEFIECIVYQYVLHGNAYALRQEKNGRLISLVPLMSQQMEVELTEDGAIIYHYQEGTTHRVFSSKSIVHFKLFGNGIVGVNPLRFARNTIAVGQAAEKQTGKVYKNGGKPSGVLMLDRTLKPEQRDQIKSQFSGLSEGNNDRLFVLEAAMQYKAVSLSPQDIELLSARRFQIEDIARFFGVPSILINDAAQNTAWGSGISEIIQGFYKFGLVPYMKRIKGRMAMSLLKPDERLKYFFDFDFESLLEPSFSERVKSGKEGVTGGLITPNEWRNKEGMTDKPAGDKLYLQQQMTPIEDLDKIDRKTVKDAKE